MSTLLKATMYEIKKSQKALRYLCILLVTAPVIMAFLAPVILFASLLDWLGLNYYSNKHSSSKYGRKTVLITGAPHTKGLQVCRFMKSVGHRVILADMQSFTWNMSRFSRAVDEWVALPDLDNETNVGYKRAILSLLISQNVDWWIPVSHTATAPVDTQIKNELRKFESKVKVLSYDLLSTVDMLDDKMAFLSTCNSMELPIPDFYQISSVDQLKPLKDKGIFRSRHYFLKPLSAYSEDRENFNRIPDDEDDFWKYVDEYRNRVSADTPYFVNEYIKGSEYTGNCVVSNGHITLFTSHPSSPMQIDFENCSTEEHKQIFDWVNTFCEREKLTGSICFDFMKDNASGRLVAIECNPRLHSGITVLKNQMEEAAEAFGLALEEPTALCGPDDIIQPSATQRRVMWLYNEIGKFAHVDSIEKCVQIFEDIFRSEDAVFDWHDPVPFFVLGHVQMPYQICAHLINGKRWNILNFCLGQLR